jgi:hypothetical protein
MPIAKRELGLSEKNIINTKFIFCQDVFNPSNMTSGGVIHDWHSIWQFHCIEVDNAFEPILDSTSDEYRWVRSLKDVTVPEPVRLALEAAKLI